MKQHWILILFLSIVSLGFSQETSTTILNSAYEKAEKEDKAVWILFSASWCDDCTIFKEKIEDNSIKDIIESHYVIANLIVNETKKNRGLETAGAEYLLNLYMGKKAGLPYFLIFDKNQGLIGNSFNQKGSNIKLPTKELDVESLINTLKKTSTMSPEDLDKIKAVFLVN